MVYPLQISNNHSFSYLCRFLNVALSVRFVTISMLFARAYSNIVRLHTHQPGSSPSVRTDIMVVLTYSGMQALRFEPINLVNFHGTNFRLT